MSKFTKLDPSELVTTVRYTKTPTREFFAELRRHRLYVPGWAFSQYYSHPEYELPGGAIVATAYLNNVPIAVAIIDLEHGYARLPMIGFFTRVKYRRNNIAKFLGQLVYEKYCELGYTEPVKAENGSWTRNWGTGTLYLSEPKNSRTALLKKVDKLHLDGILILVSEDTL
ncbi:MAG: hypothetical protein HC836_10560 [Richelia sp. RM2_1_2]|nr:hypothetical protein [Richelia sp. RM2_1_2]